MKFKSEQEEKSAVEILKAGKKTKFWELIVQSVEESIEYIQKQQDGEDISSLTAEQYKHTNELFKAKKRFLETLIKTPDNLASWLGQPEEKRKEFDPYEK